MISFVIVVFANSWADVGFDGASSVGSVYQHVLSRMKM